MLRVLKSRIPQSVRNLYHLAQAVMACIIFGFPGRHIQVIGVTGTNGKTTVTRLISAILEEAGHAVARASTIDFKIGDEEWTNATKYTTLSPFAVQRFLRRAVRAGCRYAVLETSSHALDQYRVWGVPYAVAVVTNITREHLDYHGTMADYRETKRRLFDKASVGVLNLDMEDPEDFRCRFRGKCVTYSLTDPQAALMAQDIETDLDGSSFSVEGVRFTFRLPGRFNVENALAAIAVGMVLDVPLETARRALARVDGIPGRLETVPNIRDLRIIIDYAVTPDSLEKLYALISRMRPVPEARIIAVFGACGERDRGKRPLMGEIVASYSDIVILTNEDPYHEDPRRIVREIARGVKGKRLGTDYFRILDRRRAIQKALRLARPGDIVVVTGKGAEETMAVGDKRIPWNDRRVIEELLGGR